MVRRKYLQPASAMLLTSVRTQGVKGGKQEDFHGRNIPVDGETVARVVKERLAVPIT